jgi:hypothetical protein
MLARRSRVRTQPRTGLLEVFSPSLKKIPTRVSVSPLENMTANDLAEKDTRWELEFHAFRIHLIYEQHTTTDIR